MDIGNRFSLEDFLAYFFPGVAGALGIYVLTNMLSINSSLPSLSADITTSVIFFVLSYLLGVIYSSFAELAFSKGKSHKEVMPVSDDMNSIIITTFRETFKIPRSTKIEWSRDHFYLCRSIVYERVPSVIPFLQRQSSLRQLRISLLPTFCVWLLIGIVWGIQNILNRTFLVGSAIIIASVLLFIVMTVITIDRARSNERREVREVLTAFVASRMQSQSQEKTKTRNP